MSERKDPRQSANVVPLHIPDEDASWLSDLRDLRDLEAPICDLARLSKVAFLMTMHDTEYPEEEGLGLTCVEIVERAAEELRKQFYAAGKKEN